MCWTLENTRFGCHTFHQNLHWAIKEIRGEPVLPLFTYFKDDLSYRKRISWSTLSTGAEMSSTAMKKNWATIILIPTYIIISCLDQSSFDAVTEFSWWICWTTLKITTFVGRFLSDCFKIETGAWNFWKLSHNYQGYACGQS